MDALPIRPQFPAVRPASRPPARPGAGPAAPSPAAQPAHPATAHPAAAHPATKHAATAAKTDHPADADDLEMIRKQRAFDDMVKLRAELEREANALRDMAMAQVKRDDQAMQAWIKLI